MDLDQLATSINTVFTRVFSGFILFLKEFIRVNILFKHREGLGKYFVHYMFLGQVDLSLEKYLMTIYLSLGKYQLLLFPHPCVSGY